MEEALDLSFDRFLMMMMMKRLSSFFHGTLLALLYNVDKNLALKYNQCTQSEGILELKFPSE